MSTYIIVNEITEMREVLPQPESHRTFQRHVVGRELVQIELLIDERQLATVLGARAARNKNGRSTTASGMVKARVLRRKPMEGAA